MEEAASCQLIKVAFHVAAGIALSAAVSALEPSAKSLLSLLAPQHIQGRSIGLMATLGGVGGMAGNIVGTALYSWSKHHRPQQQQQHGASWGDGGGALPFTVVAALLAAAAAAVWSLPRVTGVPRGQLFHDHDPGKATAAAEGQKAPLSSSSSLSAPDGEEANPSCCEGSASLGALLRETSYDLKLN